jgi:hypothetical protein
MSSLFSYLISLRSKDMRKNWILSAEIEPFCSSSKTLNKDSTSEIQPSVTYWMSLPWASVPRKGVRVSILLNSYFKS